MNRTCMQELQDAAFALCKAAVALHGRGLVHRDLRMSNVVGHWVTSMPIGIFNQVVVFGVWQSGFGPANCPRPLLLHSLYLPSLCHAL